MFLEPPSTGITIPIQAALAGAGRPSSRARAAPPKDAGSERAQVTVDIEQVSTNSRSFEDEHGNTETIEYPKDVSHLRLECSIARAKDKPMRCSRSTTSRACGTVEKPVPCDSY